MRRFCEKIAILLLVFIVTFHCIAIADVGDFESYDSGFDSSYDSSWDSSFDSSFNSSWNYDNEYYSGEGSGDLGGSIAVAILIILIIIAASRSGKVATYSNSSSSLSNDEVDSRLVLKQVKQVDEFFNEADFLSYAKNVFVKLQNAWTARDWEVIRPLETEDLFEQHSNQLKQYISRKQINVMERIAVNYAKLYSFEQDNDKDTLSILLNSSMIDYIKEEETDKIVMGDKTTRRTKTYLMTFIRKKGVKTSQSTGEVKTTNCPNCGAPTRITSTGKCEYCGAVIKTGNHDWVLSNLEPYK